jgi:hypothetical protein
MNDPLTHAQQVAEDAIDEMNDAETAAGLDRDPGDEKPGENHVCRVCGGVDDIEIMEEDRHGWICFDCLEAELEDEDYSKAPPQHERDADEAYDRWVDEGGTRS